MTPLPPLPSSTRSADYLVYEGSDAVIAVPASAFRMQGLMVLFLVPLALVLLTLLLVAGSGAPDAAWVGGGLLCVGTAFSTLAGGAQILLAGRRSARSRVRVGVDRRLVLPGGRTLAPGEVQALRLGKPSALLKWDGILARTARGEVLLLGRLPPAQREATGAVTTWLGEALGVPATVAPATLGMSPDAAAAFCYMPIQGIWLLFSLLALVASKDRTVRFAARQSLVFYGLTGALLLALMLPLVGLSAVLPEDVGPPLLGLGVMVLVLPLGLLRLGVGIVAAWRAGSGRPWVIPGFGWITRRWLPPPA